MNWREQVTQLEHEGNFDIAIFLLEKIIKENPDDMDAYIFLLYRFMDSFLENTCYWLNSKDPLREIKQEYYEDKIWHGYAQRVQKCFKESYVRFSENPEYIYYVSGILLHACCMMGLADKEDLLADMYKKAKASGYNSVLEQKYPDDPDNIVWATNILKDSSIQQQLATKGAAGDYLLGGKISWARKILKDHKIHLDQN